MIKLLISFEAGAFLYGMIELLWRGRTHWTMMILGGISFALFYLFIKKYKKMSLWKRCVFGALIITILEFIAGYIVNIKLKWNVWNYSNAPLNLLGQICAGYTILWGLLSIPMTALAKKIELL